MMHLPPHQASGPAPMGATVWSPAVQPALVLCDERARVLLANEAARQTLAAGEVMYLRAGDTLAVRSHGAGLLALRSAVRAAAFDGLAQSIELRHGTALLRVFVAPLPGFDRTWPGALLALGRDASATPVSLADLLAGWHDKPSTSAASI